MARSLPAPFLLTARAENLLHGRLDLDDTIRRLQAFEQAGADVLYAPGLRDVATIRTVVSSVTRPVNVVVSFIDPSITLAQLAEAGVKRVSVGGSLSRLALAAFLTGAREMKDAGGFTWLRDMVPIGELRVIFSREGQGRCGDERATAPSQRVPGWSPEAETSRVEHGQGESDVIVRRVESE